MNTDQWGIKSLLTRVADGQVPLTSSLMDCLVEELQASLISTSTLSPAELSGAIDVILARKIANLPSSLRQEISNSDYSSGVGVIFALGQLEFAHMLAAHASERTANEEFISTLKDRRFIAYIELIRNGNVTNVEIAENLHIEEETVSRNLKKLRALGIADFRREGRNVINFLTPAALQLVREGESVVGKTPKKAGGLIGQMKSNTPEFLQERLNLAPRHNGSYA